MQNSSEAQSSGANLDQAAPFAVAPPLTFQDLPGLQMKCCTRNSGDSRNSSGDSQRVYLFREAFSAFAGEAGLSAASRDQMKARLGGKGAGLAEMTASGVNVPPGLTITTDTCLDYYRGGQVMPAGLMEEVTVKLSQVEARVGRRLGDAALPLLVSVRSGAKFSMPGMMDTILNLGLNDATVKGLALLTENDRFAWDSYRRFIQMYGNVVLEIPKEDFEHLISALKQERGVTLDNELTAEALQELVGSYKALVEARTGNLARALG